MFNFIKNSLQKIYNQVSVKLSGLFSSASCDEQTFKELEIILLNADTGVKTTRTIIQQLKQKHLNGAIVAGSDLKKELEAIGHDMLTMHPFDYDKSVILLVGINGSGKTTCAGKLAHTLQKQGKKVLLVAADTFRAAATQQLCAWATRFNIEVITGKENQDPASVVFQGCQTYRTQGYDALIIDTAGRLQTKIPLMKELEKIKRVIAAQLTEEPICTLLTIDSMLGQNSFDQATLFHQSTPIDGIILTKMDGTGKGGIVFAITQELKIPVAYISFGEEPHQFKQFNPREYITALFE